MDLDALAVQLAPYSVRLLLSNPALPSIRNQQSIYILLSMIADRPISGLGVVQKRLLIRGQVGTQSEHRVVDVWSSFTVRIDP
jgi:hypothetical protein